MESMRARIYRVIFEAETPAGRGFDLILLWAILLSVLTVLLESVSEIRSRYGPELRLVEWGFTLLFTIEYLLRIYSARRRIGYLFSFFGFVDLLSILPTYMSAFLPGAQSLLVVRAFRLLRVFRILKLTQFTREGAVLLTALRESRPKITIFLTFVAATVLLMGTVMYLVEGEAHGFTSVPRGIYWAIVTMTTVGYGDVTPVTPIGQAIAAIVMILGYGVIAVPTGILTVSLSDASRRVLASRRCGRCNESVHIQTAVFCHRCGARMDDGA